MVIWVAIQQRQFVIKKPQWQRTCGSKALLFFSAALEVLVVLEPVPAVFGVKAGEQPGQVASLSLGHKETNNLFALTHAHTYGQFQTRLWAKTNEFLDRGWLVWSRFYDEQNIWVTFKQLKKKSWNVTY